MTVTDAFIGLVRGPENALHLDHAALLLAAHATPGLDVSAGLDRLDDLALRCPEPTLGGLRHLLFDEMGFAGDTEDYSDPRNSFLDQVLDRRRGIPISLSVLMMEIGRRVGVPLEGVGMPGHFLVRHTVAPRVLIDPFHGGRVLDADQCADLFSTLFGMTAPLPASVLDAARPRAILARMLANLKQSYVERRDPASLLWVGRLRAAIPGVDPREMAQLAQTLVNFGRFGEAADALEELAAAHGEGGKSMWVQARALRARLN
ncbi:MAG TPA: transglutaminase-like domain-containing protein [Acidimicrobiales bacterium]|nr:transglutaminase-like domain-containing protein [Acidimicrobiales bacterium]